MKQRNNCLNRYVQWMDNLKYNILLYKKTTSDISCGFFYCQILGTKLFWNVFLTSFFKVSFYFIKVHIFSIQAYFIPHFTHKIYCFETFYGCFICLMSYAPTILYVPLFKTEIKMFRLCSDLKQKTPQNHMIKRG